MTERHRDSAARVGGGGTNDVTLHRFGKQVQRCRDDSPPSVPTHLDRGLQLLAVGLVLGEDLAVVAVRDDPGGIGLNRTGSLHLPLPPPLFVCSGVGLAGGEALLPRLPRAGKLPRRYLQDPAPPPPAPVAADRSVEDLDLHRRPRPHLDDRDPVRLRAPPQAAVLDGVLPADDHIPLPHPLLEGGVNIVVQKTEAAITNTGVAEVPLGEAQEDDLRYVPDPVGVALKEALFATTQPEVAASMAENVANFSFSIDGAEAVAAVCPDGCPPAVKNVRGQALHEQETTYTCGPAAARNVLQQLTGVDHGEGSLASSMNTRSDNGTIIQSVAKVMNQRQSYDTFYVRQLDNATDYMTFVTGDVHYQGHGLINNVQTKPLSFWGGHAARHYNVSYGYDHRGGGRIAIAEEWNPARFGIGLQSYGNQNPVGYHGAEPLSNAWAAIKANKSMVVW